MSNRDDIEAFFKENEAYLNREDHNDLSNLLHRSATVPFEIDNQMFDEAMQTIDNAKQAGRTGQR